MDMDDVVLIVFSIAAFGLLCTDLAIRAGSI